MNFIKQLLSAMQETRLTQMDKLKGICFFTVRGTISPAERVAQRRSRVEPGLIADTAQPSSDLRLGGVTLVEVKSAANGK